MEPWTKLDAVKRYLQDINPLDQGNWNEKSQINKANLERDTSDLIAKMQQILLGNAGKMPELNPGGGYSPGGPGNVMPGVNPSEPSFTDVAKQLLLGNAGKMPELNSGGGYSPGGSGDPALGGEMEKRLGRVGPMDLDEEQMRQLLEKAGHKQYLPGGPPGAGPGSAIQQLQGQHERFDEAQHDRIDELARAPVGPAPWARNMRQDAEGDLARTQALQGIQQNPFAGTSFDRAGQAGVVRRGSGGGPTPEEELAAKQDAFMDRHPDGRFGESRIERLPDGSIRLRGMRGDAPDRGPGEKVSGYLRNATPEQKAAIQAARENRQGVLKDRRAARFENRQKQMRRENIQRTLRAQEQFMKNLPPAQRARLAGQMMESRMKLQAEQASLKAEIEGKKDLMREGAKLKKEENASTNAQRMREVLLNKGYRLSDPNDINSPLTPPPGGDTEELRPGEYRAPDGTRVPPGWHYDPKTKELTPPESPQERRQAEIETTKHLAEFEHSLKSDLAGKELDERKLDDLRKRFSPEGELQYMAELQNIPEPEERERLATKYKQEQDKALDMLREAEEIKQIKQEAQLPGNAIRQYRAQKKAEKAGQERTVKEALDGETMSKKKEAYKALHERIKQKRLPMTQEEIKAELDRIEAMTIREPHPNPGPENALSRMIAGRNDYKEDTSLHGPENALSRLMDKTPLRPSDMMLGPFMPARAAYRAITGK